MTRHTELRLRRATEAYDAPTRPFGFTALRLFAGALVLVGALGFSGAVFFSIVEALGMFQGGQADAPAALPSIAGALVAGALLACIGGATRAILRIEENTRLSAAWLRELHAQADEREPSEVE